jgi:hypothetical protein
MVPVAGRRTLRAALAAVLTLLTRRRTLRGALAAVAALMTRRRTALAALPWWAARPPVARLRWTVGTRRRRRAGSARTGRLTRGPGLAGRRGLSLTVPVTRVRVGRHRDEHDRQHRDHGRGCQRDEEVSCGVLGRVHENNAGSAGSLVELSD